MFTPSKYLHLMEDIIVVIMGVFISLIFLPKYGSSIAMSGVFISVILGSAIFAIREHVPELRRDAKLGIVVLLLTVIICAALVIFTEYPKSMLYSTAILMVCTLVYFSYVRSSNH